MSNNPDVADKLREKAENVEEATPLFIEFAKEHGFELTEEDFKAHAQELSERELVSVAGGGECICLVGGGGTETDDYVGLAPACGCVAYGQGNTVMDGDMRCVCIVSGYGEIY